MSGEQGSFSVSASFLGCAAADGLPFSKPRRRLIGDPVVIGDPVMPVQPALRSRPVSRGWRCCRFAAIVPLLHVSHNLCLICLLPYRNHASSSWRRTDGDRVGDSERRREINH
jgi:hypothetical protein